MTFLPIVERELRVAARRKATYQNRIYAAVIAIAVSLIFLLTSRFFRASSVGSTMFVVLSGYAMCVCLLAGVFITADCLSEEKREGTLGLLFLTDLRAYDVVLGKFLAMSLNAFYCLLALVPVLALPMLLGGVSGGEFARMALTLVNSLFFSLSVGMFISAINRDAQRAMGTCFFMLVLLVVGFAVGDSLMRRLWPASHLRYLSAASPFAAFSGALESSYFMHARDYWRSLVGLHLQGWFWLGLAIWVLPRVWQDKVKRTKVVPVATPAPAGTDHRREKQQRRRARLLDINPVLWLAGDTRTEWVPLLVGINLAIWGLFLYAGGQSGMPYWYTIIAGFALKLLFALQASRFLVEARRSGAIELLLSTPLSDCDILRGQWLGLRRIFLWPFAILAIQQIISLVQMESIWGRGRWLILAGSISMWVLDPLAMGWFGMWLALSLKRPQMASGFTVGCLLILPKIFFCIPFPPDVVIDIVVIIWARSRLRNGFRTLATQHLAAGIAETVIHSPVPPVVRKSKGA